MEITIKYFGMLTEITNCNEEIYSFANRTVNDLLQELYHKYPLLEGKNFQVVQNNEIISKDSIVTTTELALLPPFAGG